MDYTVVLSCCVVCLSVLAGLLIVSLVFYKITEKKQEEMTKREQERTEARQAKYRNELYERQLMYGGGYQEETGEGAGDIISLLGPVLGQLLNKGGDGANNAASFPGESGSSEDSQRAALSEGVRLV